MGTSVLSTTGIAPIAPTSAENGTASGRVLAKKPKKNPDTAAKRAVWAQLMSEVLSYWGVRDNTPRRASSDVARIPSNHKVRQQYSSLLDQLLAGKNRKPLPEMIHALHLVLGEVATIKYNATPEQNARPYIDAYFRDASREDLLRAIQRLDVLAGAESLFETMNETNRQDVKGLIAELKCSALQELARQTIGEPLRMLAGRLSEAELNVSSIRKALFALADAMYDTYNDGVPLVPYVASGLSNLPPGTTRVLSAVLAPAVPAYARGARDLLERVIQETPQDTPAAAAFGGVLANIVHDGVRAHVASYVDALVADMARKLDNAVRPGVRTAEVGNLVKREIRRKLEAIGWVYLDGAPDDADHRRWEDQAIRTETEHQFVRALEWIQGPSVGEFLLRADTELLAAMHGYRHRWSEAQRRNLAAALDRACDARLASLHDAVEQARLAVHKVLNENRRVATAHHLVDLGDALAAYERFARLTGASQTLDDDPAVHATIRDAAASLRLAGEPGALGQLSLHGLDDTAFADLRHASEPLAPYGLALDPSAVAAEVSRRAHRLDLDAALRARLAQFSELVRGPRLAPLSFTAMVAALAQADVARRETLSALGDRSAGTAPGAASPALIRGLVQVLSRGDGKPPVQWKELRRHVAGLLALLRKIDAALDPGGARHAWQAHGVASPGMLQSAIAILQTIQRHRDIGVALRTRAPSASPPASRPRGATPRAFVEA